MVYNFAVICALLFHVALCAVVTTRSPASVSQIMRQINTATQSRGGVYSNYSCKTVSWDDGDRGTVDGQLSAWGASITDTRLWAKDGTLLFTVRTDNWDEKLGHVEAKDINLIASKYGANGEHETITLEQFLQNSGKYGSYAGLPADSSLANPDLDTKVSVRFQTTFLPVADEENAKIEFATEAYNYNTISDADPKNLVVLATSQGIAVQQDGKGAKKLYHHVVDIGDGLITRHWLEAERTQHKVGGAQNESSAEAVEAAKRGKAQAKAVGIPAMGKRFNVLMTVQIPLNQSNPNAGGDGQYLAYAPLAANNRRVMEMEVGESSAARVSIGSVVDTWDGLTVEDPQRSPDQHVTVTIQLYNTVAGGVPSEEDIVAAIDDMEKLYKACNWSGRLSEQGADFMKNELTNETMGAIQGKIVNQPYGGQGATALPIEAPQ